MLTDGFLSAWPLLLRIPVDLLKYPLSSEIRPVVV